jgi:enoyl-CoA hydratase
MSTWFKNYPGLIFERPERGVLLITINRPDHRNATDAALHQALSRVWLDVHEDDDTRVAIITGAGETFSVGGDSDWVSELTQNYSLMKTAFTEAGDIVYNMAHCSKVIISAINGTAVGAGLAVALMADISVIADDARIADGHVRMGVVAGDHANIIWPLLCSLAKTKYLLLTAEFVDGLTADRIGLVSKSVPAAQLLSEVFAIARKVANSSPDAVRLTKRAINLWVKQAAPAFDASLAFEMMCLLGPDVAEAMAAMRDKRPADNWR